MNTTTHNRTSRALIGVVLAAITLLLAPSSSQARSYVVKSCRDGILNNSWVASVSDSRAAAFTNCNGGGGGGMYAYVNVPPAANGIPPFGFAQMRIAAPTGTAITSVTADTTLTRRDDDYAVLLQFNDGQNVNGCPRGACALFNPGDSYDTSTHHNYTHAGATSFRAVIACGEGGFGCYTDSTGVAPYSRAHIAIRSAQVTIDDRQGPTLTRASGTLGTNSNWFNGIEAVGHSATDNTGIKALRLYVDGRLISSDTPACDYTRTVPCPTSRTANWSIDTRDLSDGSHTYRAQVEDAAGTIVNSDRTFLVDNHAPARATNTTLTGGSGWSSTLTRSYSWTNPSAAGGSPIVRAHVETCKVSTTQCSIALINGTNPNGWSSAAATGGQPGEYTLRVWLEDAAGNVSAASKSDPVTLRYDNVAPGKAQPTQRNGWINREEANTYQHTIRLEPNATRPVSGIAGYSATVNGATVDNTVDANGETASFNAGDLPEGVSTIRAKAMSGANVPSAVVGEATVQVDRTDPVSSITGVPAPTDWQHGAVRATVSGTDQAHLSGMVAADPQAPVTNGAFVSYRVDNGPVQHVRGDKAEFDVAEDGAHNITYRVTDLAGNQSSEKNATVRIDGTLPFAVFEAPQAAAPNQLAVSTADATSGVERAVVEIRRIGTAPALRRRGARVKSAAAAAGSWQEVGTTRSGDRFTASFDPDTLTPGAYEARARVTDAAGNTRTATGYRDGRPVQVVVYPPSKDGGGSTIVINGVTGRPVDDGRCRVNCTRTKVAAAFVVRSKKLPGYCRKPRTRKQKQKCKKLRKQGARPAKARLPRYCKRPRTKARKRKCRKLAAQQQATNSNPLTRLPKTLKTPFGKRALARGIATTADGRPLTGVVVDVNVQLRHAGARLTRVAAVHTNHQGGFSYPVPAGPSRTIRFVYRGDKRHLESAAAITAKVPASTSIRANKRRLRLGQVLVLRGKLKRLGAPVPTAGKLIDLQAKDRGKWRKFATVRTNKKGAWKARYRFEATRGTVTYPMRAVVRREGAYAFDTGMSRAIGIKVRGR